MHTNIVLVEDTKVGQLNPIVLARPAYAVTCGGYRLIDWLALLECPLFGLVRAHLREIQHADHPILAAEAMVPGDATLFVNARLVPSVAAFRRLKSLASVDRSVVVKSAGRTAAALLRREHPLLPTPWSPESLSSWLEGISVPAIDDPDLALIEYPHDVVRYNMLILRENLEYRVQQGQYAEIREGVFVAPGTRLGDHAVTVTRSGPVVVERDASIGPFCYLSGPAWIGAGAKLIEYAAIKDAVTIGHTTKIGGEVEASIVEPFTNKQHHGFLGHSYLGSWINLGAGTCNSDLKNTYGKVNMEYAGQRVASGMQFLGCLMGDYSKTAINTGIFTGKTVGVCSMLYGFVTANVPSFVNYARLFGQVTELPPEVMIATQERMFQRRKVAQRPCDIQLIHDMYELTRDERELAGEPLAL